MSRLTIAGGGRDPRTGVAALPVKAKTGVKRKRLTDVYRCAMIGLLRQNGGAVGRAKVRADAT